MSIVFTHLPCTQSYHIYVQYLQKLVEMHPYKIIQMKSWKCMQKSQRTWTIGFPDRMQRHDRLIAAKAHSLWHTQGLCENDSGDVAATFGHSLGVTSSREKSREKSSSNEDFTAFLRDRPMGYPVRKCKESMPGIPPHRMSRSTAEEVDIPRPKQSDLRCLLQNAGELSLSRVLYATSSVMFNHGFSHILQVSPLFVPLHKYKTIPQKGYGTVTGHLLGLT